MIGVYEVTAARAQEERRFFSGEPRYDTYVRTYDLEFRLAEKWKGDLPSHLRREYEVWGTGGIDDFLLPAITDRFLIFLKKDEVMAKITPDYVNHPVTLVNLRAPARKGSEIVAITADFDVLADGNRVVDLVRRRLREHPVTESLPFGVSPHAFDVEVPGNRPARQVLDNHSSVFLMVPEDLRPGSGKHQ